MASTNRGASGFLGSTSRRGEAFLASDLQALKEAILRCRLTVEAPLELVDLGRGGSGLRLMEGDQPFAAMTGAGGIPGASAPGSDGVIPMGSGDVTVYDASRPPNLSPTTVTRTVYNLATLAAEPNTLIQCKYLDGTPVIDWEACPSS